MALAHQGGWDEALVVLAPLMVIALLLWVANRRARQRGPLVDHTPADAAQGRPEDDPDGP